MKKIIYLFFITAVAVSCKKDVPPELPSLVTADVTSISGTKVTCGGSITDDGGSFVTARGVCWSSNPLPTIADSKTEDGTSTGTFASYLTGLMAKTSYYVRAYATNAVGTAYGPEVPFNTGSLIIGDTYMGGKVAYVLQSGDAGWVAGETHGLIAALSDQSTGMGWYNGSYIVTGATGVAIGTGNANTTAIVAAQGNGNYAAKLCYDLVLGGYNDWYLPSKDELWKLYLNQASIGGFNPGYFYWCSTEKDVTYAYIVGFGGAYMDNNKNLTHRVRAIRSF
ncbi:MAG: hypothetical protein WCQ95_04125 [Bacteroidota bacterium]